MRQRRSSRQPESAAWQPTSAPPSERAPSTARLCGAPHLDAAPMLARYLMPGRRQSIARAPRVPHQLDAPGRATPRLATARAPSAQQAAQLAPAAHERGVNAYAA